MPPPSILQTTSVPSTTLPSSLHQKKKVQFDDSSNKKPRKNRKSLGDSQVSTQDTAENPGVSGTNRPRSPIWKTEGISCNFDDFVGNVKDKGLQRDELHLESHKEICNLIVQSSQKTAAEISNAFIKVEKEIEAIKSECNNNKDLANETSLGLYYEKKKYENCAILFNCSSPDFAEEILNYVTDDGFEEEPDTWPVGMNKQHTAVRLDSNSYTKLMQMKAFKLSKSEKYASISIRPMRGPIEMSIIRTMQTKVNNLNEQPNPEFNGRNFNTKDGNFRIIDGAIRFLKNKPID